MVFNLFVVMHGALVMGMDEGAKLARIIGAKLARLSQWCSPGVPHFLNLFLLLVLRKLVLLVF